MLMRLRPGHATGAAPLFVQEFDGGQEEHRRASLQGYRYALGPSYALDWPVSMGRKFTNRRTISRTNGYTAIRGLRPVGSGDFRPG